MTEKFTILMNKSLGIIKSKVKKSQKLIQTMLLMGEADLFPHVSRPFVKKPILVVTSTMQASDDEVGES